MITDLDDLRDVARMYSSSLRSMSNDPRIATSDSAILLGCSTFLAGVARRAPEQWVDLPSQSETALERILRMDAPYVERRNTIVRIPADLAAAANDVSRATRYGWMPPAAAGPVDQAPWYARAWAALWRGW